MSPQDVGMMLKESSMEFLNNLRVKSGGIAQADALKKLAEGPPIRYRDLPSLEKALLERLGQVPDLGTPHSPGRKLNRIAGQLEAKLSRMEKDEFSAAVGSLLDLLRAQPVQAEVVLKNAQRILLAFSHEVGELGAQERWYRYNTVSSFGPLGYVLSAGASESDARTVLHQGNLSHLRNLRQLMAQRKGASVVAHRGSGPTNRTMGGLISQTDQRRLNRPAENSPEAFEAALAETTGAAGPLSEPLRASAGLDGVECDVFLSKNDVPIVSHEGKVFEQLDAVQQLAEIRGPRPQGREPIGSSTEIGSLTAEQVTAVTRTQNPKSRFMTLPELVDQVAAAAPGFYAATGHPIRLEIEMKGTKDNPSLVQAVSRSLSRFAKGRPDVPIEVILFNNNVKEVVQFSQLRQQKTALGALYTGVGALPGESAVEQQQLHVDEIRYMLNKVLSPEGKNLKEPAKLPLAETHAALESFIVTLVHGQEFAPTGHPQYATALQSQEPSEEVMMHQGLSRHGVETGKARRFDDMVVAVLKGYVEKKGRADKLHILTDYPKKASFLKQEMMRGKSDAVQARSPQSGNEVEEKKKEKELAQASETAATSPWLSLFTGGSTTTVGPQTPSLPRSQPSPGSGQGGGMASGRTGGSSQASTPSAQTRKPVPQSQPSSGPRQSGGSPSRRTGGSSQAPTSPSRTPSASVTRQIGSVGPVHGKGFAFIDGTKVFLSPPVVSSLGLSKGVRVSYIVVGTDKGLEATQVQRV